MTRTYPIPPAHKTLHMIGDLHWGHFTLTESRRSIVADDITTRSGLPDVPYRLQMGDLTDTAQPEQDAAAMSWMESLGGTPLYLVGNHDMYFGRTGAQAAAAWGAPGKDYTLDLGYALLVVIGPDALNTGSTGVEYHSVTQTWLDTQLTAATGPVIIAAHAPLQNTEAKLSHAYEFSAQPNAEIRAVLADHSARLPLAWCSGHTHSPITTANLAKAETVGGGTMLALNTSSLSRLSTANAWTDHLISFFLTVEDDRWDVRFRNHGAHQWVGGVGGSTERRVWTMPFAA